MLQPFPDTACRHHTPGGLANSSIAGTLQHIMQVPQARPGTRCGGSGIANSSPFMRSSGLRAYLQRAQYSINAARPCRWQRGRVTMTKDTMHLAAFTAIGGSLLMAVGLFVPARTEAQ